MKRVTLMAALASLILLCAPVSSQAQVSIGIGVRIGHGHGGGYHGGGYRGPVNRGGYRGYYPGYTVRNWGHGYGYGPNWGGRDWRFGGYPYPYQYRDYYRGAWIYGTPQVGWSISIIFDGMYVNAYWDPYLGGYWYYHPAYGY